MTNSFNQLSPAEAERLAILSEECGEVIQIIGKILRHGYASRHPDDMPDGPDNRAELAREVGHLHATFRLLADEGDIGHADIARARTEKVVSRRRWMHHQEDAG